MNVSRTGVVTGLVFAAALVVAFLTRPHAGVGIALLFLIFVPIEKLFALRRQKVLRNGIITDLTHLLVNNLLVTAAAFVVVVVSVLPLLWVRTVDIEGTLPAPVSISLAVVLVFVGSYWGHRLTHTVPQLWRFHAVHHSSEQMDWVAAGRLHPLDAAFTQAFTVMPLVVLGYNAGVFAGVTIVITLLAIFQHANVRLQFPYVRWVITTPEWHHWHHSVDPEARDKNFGLPIVDRIFGTAYLPKDRRPTGFGTTAPVPPTGYLQHLAYPFTKSARDADGPPAAACADAPRQVDGCVAAVFG
jgi:sterol desaturase/sphingolipid hydroxylase (fatty acid hydroxylase superfamily)